MFGVRRPLRAMAHALGLNDEQVERIDELKTERAQAAADERRSLGLVADALAGADFDRAKVEEALALRVRSAERLRDSVLAALSDALTQASAAGQWDVVATLARELQARREARGA